MSSPANEDMHPVHAFLGALVLEGIGCGILWGMRLTLGAEAPKLLYLPFLATTLLIGLAFAPTAFAMSWESWQPWYRKGDNVKLVGLAVAMFVVLLLASWSSPYVNYGW
jgi:hypothetical protein